MCGAKCEAQNNGLWWNLVFHFLVSCCLSNFLKFVDILWQWKNVEAFSWHEEGTFFLGEGVVKFECGDIAYFEFTGVSQLYYHLSDVLIFLYCLWS